MIWQLVKRDPAWRGALIGMALGAAIGALAHGLTMVFSGLVLMYWLLSEPQRRATDFQAALPIPASDLFRARILAFFALAWLPVASGAAMLLLAGKRAEDAVALVEFGAKFSVLVLIVQSGRVREIASSRWGLAVTLLLFGPVVLPISPFGFVPLAIELVVCATVCPLLFWNIWRQLPPAFEVLPAELTPQVSSQGNTPAPAFVWGPILRSLFLYSPLPFLPLMFLQPLGGQWLYVAMFCIFPMPAAVARMPWALGLPVRRGALLAVILLQSVMTILFGFLIINWFVSKTPNGLDWFPSNGISQVRPPLEFWRAGKAPIIESPLGESWQPETVRLRGVAIYNPYSFGPGNSARFAEWQFRRATAAIYGKAFDYAYFKRYRPRVRPLTRQARFGILNLSTFACWVMLLVNLLFASMHWRVRRLLQHGPLVLSALLVVQGVLLLLIDLAPRNRLPDIISVSLVNALLLRVSAVLPAGVPAVALAAVLPVALLSWTAARLFRGVELPRPAAAVTRG
jgi:hypothetical protein